MQNCALFTKQICLSKINFGKPTFWLIMSCHKRSFLTSRQLGIFFSPKQKLWLKSPHVNEVSCEFIHHAWPTNHFPVRKMINIVELKTFWIYLATVLPSLGKGLRVTTLSSWRRLGLMLYPTYPLQLMKKDMFCIFLIWNGSWCST